MAVLPQFMPENASFSRTGDALMQGEAFGQSMMDRKARLALDQQQADQQRMEFYAKLPIIQSDAILKQVAAKAAVDNAVQNDQLETKAAAESVVAQKEFHDAITYNAGYDVPASDGTPEGDAAQAEQKKYATQETLDARVQKLADLSAKYAYMANLKDPGYGAFYQNINKNLVNANEAAHSNLKLEQLMNDAQVRADQSRYGSDSRLQGQVYRADATTTNTQLRDETRLTQTQMQGQNRLDVVTAQGENQVQKEARTIKFLSDQAVAAEQDAAAAQPTDPALAAVLRKNASNFRDAMDKRATFAGGSPSTPNAPGAPVPHKAPVPSAASVDNTPPAHFSLNIPGSSVPDPNGGGQTQPDSPAPIARPAPPAEPGKLYVVDPATKRPELGPNVRTHEDTVKAYQQMLDDGLIDAKTARAELTQLGFKPK